MTRRVAYGPDALSGPWDAHLRHGEEVIWTGTPHLGLAFDKGAVWAILPAAVLSIVYLAAILHAPGQARMLAIGPVGPVPLLFAILLYLAAYVSLYTLTVPGLTRYAITTQRAFIYRRLPWPRLSDYDIGLTAPIKRTGTAIYFADETVRHSQTFSRRPIGFRNISPAEAEAIHERLLDMRARAVT